MASLVGARGAVKSVSSERRSNRHQSCGAGEVTASAPWALVQGGTQATIVGAQPNKRLELAPPVVVELHL